ncbi:MAG TPA: hypothetical protein VFQ47_08940 [Nitrososphaera sp.]|nr:hypothetical protein [Nitrososphaera sp.]
MSIASTIQTGLVAASFLWPDLCNPKYYRALYFMMQHIIVDMIMVHYSQTVPERGQSWIFTSSGIFCFKYMN